ncbi:MAG: uroporphyrinogen decarboxylase [Blastocatellia bacterium]|nr:uroporphyrinogen decarboxylase [Blastocatellia bacterium]
MIRNDRLIRACRRQETDRAPVWMMGQAGRHLPAFRALEADADLWTICRTPDLAAEASMQPWAAFDVDAALLFTHLALPLEAMGMKPARVDADDIVFAEPVRTASQVRALIVPDPEEETPFVTEAVRSVRKRLNNAVPLIGTAGGPFTLAAHLIEENAPAGRLVETKRMMYRDPALLHELLDKIAETIILYLNAQIEAGAQVVQIDDARAGELSCGDYEEFALAYAQKVIERLHRGPGGLGVPAILHVDGCGAILEKMAESGANVLSLDWRLDLGDACRRLRAAHFENLAVQGNLDPCSLLGTPDTLTEGVREILKQAPGTGHIMNLGGPIPPAAPRENVLAFVLAAKAGIKEAA